MSQNTLSARWIGLAALTLSLLTPLAHAQEALADFHTQVPLTLSGEGSWYRVELPMALHFAAQFADLRDARVFNAEGQAQAYALTLGRAEEREKIQQTAVKWFPLRGPKNATGEAADIRVQRSSTGTLVEVTAPADAAPGLSLPRSASRAIRSTTPATFPPPVRRPSMPRRAAPFGRPR